jgi:type I restriction enzyme S subunit
MAKKETSAVTPRLRFPRFRETSGWMSQTLGDLTDVVRGGSPRPIDAFITTDSDGLNWLKIGDVPKDSKYITGTEQKVLRTALSKTREIVPGDFILSNSMSFGRPYLSRIRTCIHDGWIAVTSLPEDFNRDFLYYSMLSESSQRYFKNQAAGGGVRNLTVDIVKLLPVGLPSPAEQKSIADCLTSLDEVIAAQGRKVEALKTHKRGLMQQIFPREGETTPRLRFREFRNAPDWEKVPLGEIAEIKLGKMLDANKHKTGRLLPYINNISLRWNDVETSNLPQMYFDDDELERFGLRAGDVLVCEGGEPGRSAVWDGRLPELKFQKAVHRVRFNVPFEPKLLVLYLEAIAGTTAFESLLTGGGIMHLTLETFSRLAVPLLSLPEQKRIAACLSALDDEIVAESKMLVGVKSHKQGLMQKLFPSPAEMAS